MGDLFFHRLDRPITGMAKVQQQKEKKQHIQQSVLATE
jgi:hypothetical protein